MTEELLKEISNKLDTVITLLAKQDLDETISSTQMVANLKNLGLSNKQITLVLGISDKTVRNRVTEARKTELLNE